MQCEHNKHAHLIPSCINQASSLTDRFPAVLRLIRNESNFIQSLLIYFTVLYLMYLPNEVRCLQLPG